MVRAPHWTVASDAASLPPPVGSLHDTLPVSRGGPCAPAPRLRGCLHAGTGPDHPGTGAPPAAGTAGGSAVGQRARRRWRRGRARPAPRSRGRTRASSRPRRRRARGMFTTHMIGDRLLFEIPRARARARTCCSSRAPRRRATRTRSSAARTAYVRFERAGNRVLPAAGAVQRHGRHRVGRAHGGGGAALRADPRGRSTWRRTGRTARRWSTSTRLYTTSIREVTPMENIVADRSFVQHVGAVRRERGGGRRADRHGGAGAGPEPGAAGGGGAPARPQTVSAVVHFSLRRLPDAADDAAPARPPRRLRLACRRSTTRAASTRRRRGASSAASASRRRTRTRPSPSR